MRFFQAILGICAVWLFIFSVLALSFDALEFESTGQCTDCLVLPLISERIK